MTVAIIGVVQQLVQHRRVTVIIQTVGKSDQAAIARQCIVHHALILRDDHRIARVIVAKFCVQHMRMCLFHQTFHTLAMLAIGVDVMLGTQGLQFVHATGNAVCAGD